MLWHPKGGFVRHKIEEFWRNEHLKGGYDIVYSPHIARADLWRTSGHLDFYAESMFKGMDVDGVDYVLKPMNCPFHVQIFKSRRRSYRELPFRWAELGTVYRYEEAGALHGLMRVRGFTQDDAHLFVRPDQLEDEIERVMHFILHILRAFGFDDFELNLSTRPEKFVGEPKDWETAEKALREVAREDEPRVRRSTPAAVRSTARRSTSRSRTASAARGSVRRCSSISTCPSAST